MGEMHAITVPRTSGYWRVLGLELTYEDTLEVPLRP